MEVKKITTAVRKGVLSSFVIPDSGDMDCGKVRIDEFSNYYEVLIEREERIDQFDLSSVLFDFINSDFFSSKKFFLFNTKKICFEEKEDYNIIFSKIKPLFKKAT